MLKVAFRGSLTLVRLHLTRHTESTIQLSIGTPLQTEVGISALVYTKHCFLTL